MASTIILIGAGFVGFGALLIVSSMRKNKRCTCRTVGRITGVHEDEESDDEGFHYYSYSPEFEYEVDGQVYHGTGSKSYKKRKKIQIGGNIDIHYNPDKPNEHLVKGGGVRQSFAGILTIAIGVVLIATALKV